MPSTEHYPYLDSSLCQQLLSWIAWMVEAAIDGYGYLCGERAK